MANNIPISFGAGTASVASEDVGGVFFQQVELYGKGGGSVASIDPEGAVKVSVVGTVRTMGVAGSIATVVNPAGSVTGISGSVTAPAGSIMTITGSVTAPAGSVMAVTFAASANQSVSGAVTAPPGSIMAVTVFGTGSNTSVLGSITALQGTNPWTVVNPAGSVTAVSFAAVANQSVSGAVTNPPGSVTAVRTDNASIITVSQNSSVIATLTGTSIVGTYSEDAAHTTGDKGVFVLAVRNDLMASVTGADGDYSQNAVGPVGETIVANAPISKWVRGTADLRVSLGGSIVAIAAQGASVFTYITSAQVANMGSASVLVTITGGLGSVLGYTIAPAGGGSNIVYPNALKTGENSAVAASISGTASVLVSLQGFTAKI